MKIAVKSGKKWLFTLSCATLCQNSLFVSYCLKQWQITALSWRIVKHFVILLATIYHAFKLCHIVSESARLALHKRKVQARSGIWHNVITTAYFVLQCERL